MRHETHIYQIWREIKFAFLKMQGGNWIFNSRMVVECIREIGYKGHFSPDTTHSKMVPFWKGILRIRALGLKGDFFPKREKNEGKRRIKGGSCLSALAFCPAPNRTEPYNLQKWFFLPIMLFLTVFEKWALFKQRQQQQSKSVANYVEDHNH